MFTATSQNFEVSRTKLWASYVLSPVSMWQNRINHPIDLQAMQQEFEEHVLFLQAAEIGGKKTTGQTLRRATRRPLKRSEVWTKGSVATRQVDSRGSCLRREMSAQKYLFPVHASTVCDSSTTINYMRLWSSELKSLMAWRNCSSRTFSAKAKIKCGGYFNIAGKLSALSSAASLNPSRSAILSVIMLLSSHITNTETAFDVRSQAATENIVKITDFPKPVGKTAKTSFPSSRLYKVFSCSAFKTIVFLLKFKNNNAFLTASFKSTMILECVTNSKATALYHSLAIVPLTNQKPRLLVDGIQTLSWDGPSLPAGGFSPLSPPPSPRSLCQLSTRPRPGRANSRWRPHYVFRFFFDHPTACVQATAAAV